MRIPPPRKNRLTDAVLTFLAAAVAVCFLMLSSDNPTAPLAQAHEVDDGIPSTQTVGGDSIPAHKWKGDAESAQAYADALASADALGGYARVHPSVDVDEVVFEPDRQAEGNQITWQGLVALVAHKRVLTDQDVLIVVQRCEHRVHGWIPFALGGGLGVAGGILGIPGGPVGVLAGAAAGVGVGAFGGEAIRWILGFGVEIRNKIIEDQKAIATDWGWFWEDKIASVTGNFEGVGIHVTDEYHYHAPDSRPSEQLHYVPGREDPRDLVD